MKKTRFENLGAFIGLIEEKKLVKIAFDNADRCVKELLELGVVVEPLEKVILGDKEYSREFLNDN